MFGFFKFIFLLLHSKWSERKITVYTHIKQSRFACKQINKRNTISLNVSEKHTLTRHRKIIIYILSDKKVKKKLQIRSEKEAKTKSLFLVGLFLASTTNRRPCLQTMKSQWMNDICFSFVIISPCSNEFSYSFSLYLSLSLLRFFSHTLAHPILSHLLTLLTVNVAWHIRYLHVCEREKERESKRLHIWARMCMRLCEFVCPLMRWFEITIERFLCNLPNLFMYTFSTHEIHRQPHLSLTFLRFICNIKILFWCFFHISVVGRCEPISRCKQHYLLSIRIIWWIFLFQNKTYFTMDD